MALVDGTIVAVPPPPGYDEDIDDPQRQANIACYCVCAVGLLLSTAFMGQRLYVKYYVRHQLWWDDWSFIFVYNGVHMWEMPLSKLQDFTFLTGYINALVYVIPTALSKIVILLFLRDLNRHNKWYQASVWFMVFVVAGGGIGIFFSTMFPCNPLDKVWDLTIPRSSGECIDIRGLYKATVGLNVATDICILAIPIPMIWNLKISKKKKWGLFAMFALGSVTVITSIVRLALLIDSLTAVDQTWLGGPISVWICVEANLLIACACLSTLRHFFITIAPRFTRLTSLTSSWSRRFTANKNDSGNSSDDTAVDSFGAAISHSSGKAKVYHYQQPEMQTIGGGGGRGRARAYRDPYALDDPELGLESIMVDTVIDVRASAHNGEYKGGVSPMDDPNEKSRYFEASSTDSVSDIGENSRDSFARSSADSNADSQKTYVVTAPPQPPPKARRAKDVYYQDYKR